MDIVAISPATKTVALGSAAVEVSGLSLRKLSQLIAAYPDLLGLAAGKVDLSTIIFKAPNMALAIFAVGVVGLAREGFWQRRVQKIKEDDLLSLFDKAATGQQLDCLAVIVDLTFKGERGIPFLRSVIGLSGTSQTNSKTEPAPNEDHQGETPTSDEPTETSSSD